MVPWPIAFFVVLYTMLGTAMGADAWRAWQGRAMQRAALPLAWCAIFMTLAIGLSFMRSWARRSVVWVSVFLMVATLSAAVMAVVRVPPQPKAAMWGTLLAGAQFLAIRYLTRPRVKAWFVTPVGTK